MAGQPCPLDGIAFDGGDGLAERELELVRNTLTIDAFEASSALRKLLE